MTLVELLITIAIISILASMLLGVAAVAANSGREARTRLLITRLHTLVLEQHDSYKSRRVDLSNMEQFAPIQDNLQRADYRLIALRGLMRMELPDRWSDILAADVEDVPPNAQLNEFNLIKSRMAHPPTPLWTAYIRHYRRINTTDPAVIRQNEAAECLYLIVTIATGDGEARGLFKESDVGDTDGDGAPEFLDGWGNPISFIRWPAGFVAESDRMTGDPVSDHDPFDLYRRDMQGSRGIGRDIFGHLRDEYSAFRLVPLIFSAGTDGVGGLNEAEPVILHPNLRIIDPYRPAQQGGLAATPVIPNAVADNIHNHFISGE